MRLGERLLLEFRGAIEADDGAYNYVADFELFADAARSPGRDYQLGLHFKNDLTPHVDVGQLRTVLRHV